MNHTYYTSDNIPKNIFEPKIIFPDRDSVYSRLLNANHGQIVVSGGYETAKTVHCLMKIHMECSLAKKDVLIVRKKMKDIFSTVCLTFENLILPFENDNVRVYNGNINQGYEYINTGSRIKFTSTKSYCENVIDDYFDIVYVNACEQITEKDWVYLRKFLKNDGYGLLIGECNPKDPFHWVMERYKRGLLDVINTDHTDNPVLYKGRFTELGKQTIQRLKKLTGLDYERYVLGKWVALES